MQKKDYLLSIDEYEILAEMKGSDLAGIEYEQLMQYCDVDKKAFYVIAR
ncbi:MAG: hypothetical protein MZV64_01215 [Ignavibacteriales bacterium]|nr:hypothetical protein [Ignavibacteriales bacterium]